MGNTNLGNNGPMSQMLTKQQARAALGVLRVRRDHLNRAIAELEAFEATEPRVQRLIPRDRMRELVELARGGVPAPTPRAA